MVTRVTGSPGRGATRECTHARVWPAGASPAQQLVACAPLPVRQWRTSNELLRHLPTVEGQGILQSLRPREGLLPRHGVCPRTGTWRGVRARHGHS